VHNVVRVAPGPSAAVPLDATPKNIFDLFFSGEMVDIILRFTNKYANECFVAHNARNGTELQWSLVDQTELEALFGLLLYAGIRYF